MALPGGPEWGREERRAWEVQPRQRRVRFGAQGRLPEQHWGLWARFRPGRRVEEVSWQVFVSWVHPDRRGVVTG